MTMHAQRHELRMRRDLPQVALRAHRRDQQVEPGVAQRRRARPLQPRQGRQGEQQGHGREDQDRPGERVEHPAPGRHQRADAQADHGQHDGEPDHERDLGHAHRTARGLAPLLEARAQARDLRAVGAQPAIGALLVPRQPDQDAHPRVADHGVDDDDHALQVGRQVQRGGHGDQAGAAAGPGRGQRADRLPRVVGQPGAQHRVADQRAQHDPQAAGQHHHQRGAARGERCCAARPSSSMRTRLAGSR